MKVASKDKAVDILKYLLSEVFSVGVFVMEVDITVGLKRSWVVEGASKIRSEMVEGEVVLAPLLRALPRLRIRLFGKKQKSIADVNMWISELLVALLEAGHECKPTVGAICAWLGGDLDRSPTVTDASTDGLDMPLPRGMH